MVLTLLYPTPPEEERFREELGSCLFLTYNGVTGWCYWLLKGLYPYQWNLGVTSWELLFSPLSPVARAQLLLVLG